MPIEQVLELIKDNPDLTKEVKDMADKAGALDKVKEANVDLTKQREAWEAKEKGFNAKLEALQKSGGNNSPELLQLKEQIDALTKKAADAEEKASKAENERRGTELKNSIVGVAAAKSHNPNQIVTLMASEGLIGHDESGKPFYHRVNDKGEVVKAKNPEEAVGAFLKSNPHLEKSSGTSGSGMESQKTGAAGNGLLADPVSLL